MMNYINRHSNNIKKIEITNVSYNYREYLKKKIEIVGRVLPT